MKTKIATPSATTETSNPELYFLPHFPEGRPRIKPSIKSSIIGCAVIILAWAASANAQSTPFVTGQTLGTVRNNYTGWVGMQITVGANPITVTQLGRWVVAGNTGTHSVNVVQQSTGAILGTVSVNTSGAPAGAFKYASLSTGVTLAANTVYYVLSQETNGGDQWYDNNTLVTTTSVATVPNAIHADPTETSFYASAGANHSFVPVSFQYSTGSSAAPFVTGQTLGTVRNNYTGWVGMQITVGANPITVTQLGRWVVSGNTGTHSVNVVQQSTGAILGTVSVNTSGAPAGAFQYASLSTGVTLAANTVYYVLSQEANGGDQWYDNNTLVTTTSVATVPNAIHADPTETSFYASAGANHSFVPVSFQYTSVGTTAVSANNFLNSIGVCTHIAQGIDNPTNVATCLTYAGIRNFRDDGSTNATTIQNWINVHNATGAKACLLPINGDVNSSISVYGQVAAAGALLAAEGPNEPNNFPVTYNGQTSNYNTTFLPVAQFQAALYSAVKASPSLAGIPVFASSEAGGAEPDNVGLQFLTIPSGSGVTLMPIGTQYADYANCHNYVAGNGMTAVVDNNSWNAEWPNSPGIGPWDGLAGEYGTTWRKGFAGYSAAQLPTLPRVTTETGWQTGNTFGPVGLTYGSSTPLVTAVATSALRNDFTGWVGFAFTVGGSPITVNQLGRWVVSGNTGTHAVRLVQASNGAVLGSVSVNTSGAPAGAFEYASLGTSIPLAANTSYYLLSQETSGGDQWYHNNTFVTTTSVATVNNSEFYDTAYHNSGNGISLDQQGKLLMNLYLTAVKEGWSYTFVYYLHDSYQGNWGMFDANYNAKLSGTYLHNLTTILADTTPFTPGSLNYSIPGEPSTVHDLLIQKSNGAYYLAVWDDRPIGEGTDIVTVNLGGTYSVNKYDPTVGTSATSLGSVSTVSLTLSDHPIILQAQ